MGEVQVYTNDRWIPICYRNFGWQEAVVICRQLGFTNASRLSGKALRHSSNYLVNLNCAGREIALHQCRYQIGNNNSCTERNIVSVECVGKGKLYTIRKFK